MSNSESFIEEVTEEVRRDRLFFYFKKYGWIAILLVFALIGGTAYSEWSKHRHEEDARIFGDALKQALTDSNQPAGIFAALGALDTTPEQEALVTLLQAGVAAQDSVTQNDKDISLLKLTALAQDESQPQAYRDLAILHYVMLSQKENLQERQQALQSIAAPGRPFRVMAEEQIAYLLIEEGQKEQAVTILADLLNDGESPEGLLLRVAQVLTALGITPDDPVFKGNEADGANIPGDS